jgi:hypothetical protein
MGKLTERLQDATRCGVYRVSDPEVVRDAAGGTGLDCTRILLAGAKGKAEVLEAIARALAFPGWFGRNWDALEDCLADLSWREASGHVLVFEAPGDVPADDLGILLDVLRSSAEFWKTRGRPFFAVFADPARALALPDLYRER